MDQQIHSARIDRKGRQIMFSARLADLPDGVFVTLPEATARPILLWRGALRPWTHAGYEPPIEALPEANVNVLTPAPIVNVLRAGYLPYVSFKPATTTPLHRRGTEFQPEQLKLPL